MNVLKLSFLVAIIIFSIFIISCQQTPPPSNTANTNTNRTSAAASVDANSRANSPGNTLRSNRAAQVAEMVDVDDNIDDLYAQNCMICHKDTGKGGKVTLEGKTINAADLTSAKFKAKSDERLLAEIQNGEPEEGMPAFKGKLSDEQIKTIIAKIRKF